MDDNDRNLIKNYIVKLNIEKNEYAKKKIEGEVNIKKENELISSLIYLVSEITAQAQKLKDKNNDSEFYKEVSSANETVKQLKSQILTLVSSNPTELKEIVSKKNIVQ